MSIFTPITCQKTPTLPIIVDFDDPSMSKNRRGRPINASLHLFIVNEIYVYRNFIVHLAVFYYIDYNKVSSKN